jgi:hypothetical protein
MGILAARTSPSSPIPFDRQGIHAKAGLPEEPTAPEHGLSYKCARYIAYRQSQRVRSKERVRGSGFRIGCCS